MEENDGALAALSLSSEDEHRLWTGKPCRNIRLKTMGIDGLTYPLQK
jgi:hypothetical protein